MCFTPWVIEAPVANIEHVEINHTFIIISYQLKLIKMRAKFAYLNNCAAPFLSRAAGYSCL